MRRTLWSFTILPLFVQAFSLSVHAQIPAPPPSLTGEIFTISPPQVTASCNAAGTSTVRYTVSGVAIGPYPGTYTETGTVTIGPLTLPQFVNGYEFGPITRLVATFTINSAVGLVRGVKYLTAPSVNAFALCYTLAGGNFYEVCACSLSLTYGATIRTVNGQYGDTGRTGLILDQVRGVVPAPAAPGLFIQPTNTFEEEFVSSLSQPFLICTREDDDPHRDCLSE